MSATTATSGIDVSTHPGDAAVAIGHTKLGAPYVYGAKGPNSFDCSGFLYWCYMNGPQPGIDIGGDTDVQWSSKNTTVMYNAMTGTGPMATLAGGTPAPDAGQLQVGDILLFGQPGASGRQAHAQMYYGGGQVIEATGDHVQMNKVNLTGVGSSYPLKGIKRATGGGGSGGGGGGDGGGSGQGQGNQDTTNQHWQDVSAQTAPQIANLKDPDSNLPFSAYFMGQQMGGAGGTMQLQIPGRSPVLSTGLVRGGMAELAAKRFKCYFMMNPSQISASVGINQDNLSPLQQSADLALSGGYWVSNQNISFTLIFNRMYEVWQGNIPGPSDIGCRWDIRALERLVGIFDAVSDNGLSVGTGNYGWGQSPAMTIPLQVVFGGQNSMQFQGVLSSLEYTFTIFDANMIPVEATADVQVMRIYQPQQSNAPLVQSIITQTGMGGNQTMPGQTLPPGAVGPVAPPSPFTK